MTDDLKPYVWPIERADADAVYRAMTADRIASIDCRIPIEIQTPLSRMITAEIPGDWRMWGIQWVATEFIPDDSFRLIYSKGPFSEHKFDPQN